MTKHMTGDSEVERDLRKMKTQAANVRAERYTEKWPLRGVASRSICNNSFWPRATIQTAPEY